MPERISYGFAFANGAALVTAEALASSAQRLGDPHEPEMQGHLVRRCDPRDEGQAIVGLTDNGRQLREKGAGRTLVKATVLRRMSSQAFRKRSQRFGTICSAMGRAPPPRNRSIG